MTPEVTLQYLTQSICERMKDKKEPRFPVIEELFAFIKKHEEVTLKELKECLNELEGVECWSARELQFLLGYSKWENFEKVVQKAKDACKNAGEEVFYHFPDVRKTIAMPKGAEKEIDDILLTRYACYLIAQNGIKKGQQYAILTDIITQSWSGLTTKQYKQLKGLKTESLRDNMTNLELVLNMLAEASTTEISKQKEPETFEENAQMAREGGSVAHVARKQLEAKTSQKVVSPLSAKKALKKSNGVVSELSMMICKAIEKIIW